MAGIREVLASNLKEYRRKSGFSQDNLAERAEISTQYLATVETCRKFPTPEVLERLAAALEIEAHELFYMPAATEEALERLHRSIVDDVERVVAEAVERAVAEKCGGKGA
jgi:transcriptional regulator with XRE-family HTH domain